MKRSQLTKRSARKKAAAPKSAVAPESPVNQGRHEAQCSICKHAQREEIEHEFLTWASPHKIAKAFGVCRDSIYRHARAFDLLEPRRRNVRCALERIIERAGDVRVNANAIVSAVAAYSKLNANGQWIDRRETVNLNDLFLRMTEAEMRRYASKGELPEWFSATVGCDTNGQSGR
jgi:hypothetical protein